MVTREIKMQRKFLDVIKTYKDQPHVEVELRLGTLQEGVRSSRFETNVGKEAFDYVKRGLDKYRGWDKVVESSTEVFYNDNKRQTEDEEGNIESIVKTKIKNIDQRMEGKKFDVRLGMSKEVPAVVEEGQEIEYDRSVVKERKSYVRKDVSIDVTKVTGEFQDKDDEETEKYQIELEILNVASKSDDELINAIHKVECVLQMF